jgi:hypothetical protein
MFLKDDRDGKRDDKFDFIENDNSRLNRNYPVPLLS